MNAALRRGECVSPSGSAGASAGNRCATTPHAPGPVAARRHAAAWSEAPLRLPQANVRLTAPSGPHRNVPPVMAAPDDHWPASSFGHVPRGTLPHCVLGQRPRSSPFPADVPVRPTRGPPRRRYSDSPPIRRRNRDRRLLAACPSGRNATPGGLALRRSGGTTVGSSMRAPPAATDMPFVDALRRWVTPGSGLQHPLSLARPGFQEQAGVTVEARETEAVGPRVPLGVRAHRKVQRSFQLREVEVAHRAGERNFKQRGHIAPWQVQRGYSDPSE